MIERTIGRLFFLLIVFILGYIVLRLQHGKRHKRVVEKEYGGSYEFAGERVVFNVLLLLLLVFGGGGLLFLLGTYLFQSIKSLF